MKIEIEVKFCNIDIDDMRRRLEQARAVCEQPMRLMRRAVIEQPQHKAQHSFIRIRDEGDRATLTFKRRADAAAKSIDSVKEIEVEVSSFDDTIAIFREAGWGYKTFQESRRETWMLDDAEVVIDEWPWLPPYIEIEAASEAAIRQAASQLGLDWEDVFIGHIDGVYETVYEFLDGVRGVMDIPSVRFGDPQPAEFRTR